MADQPSDSALAALDIAVCCELDLVSECVICLGWSLVLLRFPFLAIAALLSLGHC